MNSKINILDRYVGGHVIVKYGNENFNVTYTGILDICEHTNKYVLLRRKARDNECITLSFFGERINVLEMSLDLGEFGERGIYKA